MTQEARFPKDVPPALAEWMRRYLPEDADGTAVIEGAMLALRDAKARPGRFRESAYSLLAADALATYAAELAAEAADPEAALRALVDRIRCGSEEVGG